MEPEQIAQLQQALEQRPSEYLAELDTRDTQEGAACADAQSVRAALTELEHQAQALRETQPGKRVVRTEPQAVVLKGKGPGYNVQTAVDAQHAIIVAHEVNAQAGDNGCLQSIGQAAALALQQQALQQQGIEVHAPVKRSVNNQGDGTFFERSQFVYDVNRDTYVCPAGALLERKQVHKAGKVVIYAASDGDCGACALKPRCIQAKRRLVSRHLFEAALERIHAQATPEAMRLRRCTVEHPYAALKYQIFEKPRFLLRGLAGASTEILLATLVYNLKCAINAMGPAMLLSQMRVA